ncbi:MAG: FBP domain-containing protein, partial [Brevibacterium linens]
MQQLNATQIKKSFINTSRREVEKITLPPNLAEIEWAELDYFGWADAKIPQRAYIVVPVDDVPR